MCIRDRGDGAGAAKVAGGHRVLERPGNAHQIHAVVLIEAFLSLIHISEPTRPY